VWFNAVESRSRRRHGRFADATSFCNLDPAPRRFEVKGFAEHAEARSTVAPSVFRRASAISRASPPTSRAPDPAARARERPAGRHGVPRKRPRGDLLQRYHPGPREASLDDDSARRDSGRAIRALYGAATAGPDPRRAHGSAWLSVDLGGRMSCQPLAALPPFLVRTTWCPDAAQSRESRQQIPLTGLLVLLECTRALHGAASCRAFFH
jgi:hypothetical protein